MSKDERFDTSKGGNAKNRAVELVSLMILTSCKTGAGTGRQVIDEVSGMDVNARRGETAMDG